MDLHNIQDELYLLEKHVEFYSHSNRILLQDEVKTKQDIIKLSHQLLRIKPKTISDRWKKYRLKRRIQKLYLKVDSLKTIYN